MNWKIRKISQDAKDVLLSLCDHSQQFCSPSNHHKNKKDPLPSLPLPKMFSLPKRSQTIQSSKIEMKMMELSTFLHQSLRLEAKRLINVPKITIEPKVQRIQKKYSLPSTQRSIRSILMKNKLKMVVRNCSKHRKSISRVKTCK